MGRAGVETSTSRAVTSRNPLGRALRPLQFGRLLLPEGAGLPGPALAAAPPCLPRAPARTPPSRPCSGARAPSREPRSPRAPLARVSAALLGPRLPRWSRRSAPLCARAPFPAGPPRRSLDSYPTSSFSSWRWASRRRLLSLDHSLFLISRTVPGYGDGSTDFWDPAQAGSPNE